MSQLIVPPPLPTSVDSNLGDMVMKMIRKKKDDRYQSVKELVEDLKENARKEAEVVVKDAEVRSSRIIDQAQRENAKLEADILNLRRQRHYLLQDMKKVIQTHLEMINFAEGGLETKHEQAAEKK